MQPPPRGCVLKRRIVHKNVMSLDAAASARLCVETLKIIIASYKTKAAASARLCVETPSGR